MADMSYYYSERVGFLWLNYTQLTDIFFRVEAAYYSLRRLEYWAFSNTYNDIFGDYEWDTYLHLELRGYYW